MRAIPLVVALACSTPALAQVPEDVNHSLHTPLWSMTADVSLSSSRPPFDSEAFSTAGFQTQAVLDRFPHVPPQFTLRAMAMGEDNTAEVMVDATLTFADYRRFNFLTLGPAEFSIVGPGISVEHRNALIVPATTDYIVVPGTYQVHVGLSLESGEWPAPGVPDWRDTATAQFTAYPLIPEPSTWAIAAIGLMVLGLHRAICKKR